MSNNSSQQPQAFLAPCRKLKPFVAIDWIRRGYQDFIKVMGKSLSDGVVMMVISLLITVSAYKVHSLVLAIALVAGFFFLGPIIAIGLYSLSRHTYILLVDI